MMQQQLIKTNEEIREKILSFENRLAQEVGATFGDSELCPLKHTFADGIYVREIFIPKDTVLTGKIHLHEHPNFLMQGKVQVYTEFNEMETLEAPLSMISKAGTKRVVKTLSDTVWITVHSNPTNTQDLKKLEKIVIADSYVAYDQFKNKKKSLFYSIIKLLTFKTK